MSVAPSSPNFKKKPERILSLQFLPLTFSALASVLAWDASRGSGPTHPLGGVDGGRKAPD